MWKKKTSLFSYSDVPPSRLPLGFVLSARGKFISVLSASLQQALKKSVWLFGRRLIISFPSMCCTSPWIKRINNSLLYSVRFSPEFLTFEEHSFYYPLVLTYYLYLYVIIMRIFILKILE